MTGLKAASSQEAHLLCVRHYSTFPFFKEFLKNNFIEIHFTIKFTLYFLFFIFFENPFF